MEAAIRGGDNCANILWRQSARKPQKTARHLADFPTMVVGGSGPCRWIPSLPHPLHMGSLPQKGVMAPFLNSHRDSRFRKGAVGFGYSKVGVFQGPCKIIRGSPLESPRSALEGGALVQLTWFQRFTLALLLMLPPARRPGSRITYQNGKGFWAMLILP